MNIIMPREYCMLKVFHYKRLCARNAKPRDICVYSSIAAMLLITYKISRICIVNA